MGFGWAQLGLTLGGVLTAVTGVNVAVAGSPLAGLGFLAVAVLAVTAGLGRVRGRPLTSWTPVLVASMWQRARGEDSYRGTAYVAGGDLDMPGPAGGYRWLPGVAADGATQIGLLYHRREQTVTAVIQCAGSTVLLEGRSAQDRRLSQWAQVLNILGAEHQPTGLVSLALFARSIPSGDGGPRAWLERHATADGAAYRSLAALTDAVAARACRHETYLVVVFDAARLSGPIAAAGGGDEAVSAVVLPRLAAIGATVTEAGVDTDGWLTPHRLAGLLRTQWDPADHDLLDADPNRDQVEAGAWGRLAGPTAARVVGWSTYQHDGALSRTLVVAAMPRTSLTSTWLTPIYTDAIVRRTITLVGRPVPAGAANLASRREQVTRAGNASTKRKLRLVSTARDVQQAQAVSQLDREQAAGHVRWHYGLLVTVTATTLAGLDTDVGMVRRQLARAGCASVVLYGEQDQAFLAGALPLARGLAPVRPWSA
jgi:hypothetical protein